MRFLIFGFSILMYWLDNWLVGFIIIFFVFGLFIFRKKQIIRLKFTKRIIRFIALYFPIVLLIFLVFPNCLSFVLLVIPCIICVIHIIYFPIEKRIYKFYFFKARNKLEKYKNLNIGITGSFGKTSVKNYLYQILLKNYYVLKSPNSYNTPMGLSKTINNEMTELIEIFISELGATKENDITELVDLIPVDIGVITEIGQQHLESFKSIDAILKTKLELLNSRKIKKLYINNDNPLLSNYIYPDLVEIIRIGVNENSDVLIKDIKFEFAYITFSIIYKNNKYDFETTLLGKHNILNLGIAIALSLDLNVDYLDIYDTVQNLHSVKHRLELKQLNNIQIIDDSFNSNIQGFKNAIDVLNMTKEIKILITPGIVELTHDNIILLDDLIELIIKSNIMVYGIKNRALDYFIDRFNYFNYKNILLFDSFKEAYNFAIKETHNRKTILIENDLTDYYLGG